MITSLLSTSGTIISVVIGVVAVGIVVFTAIYHYVRKKQGKSGCDCGCDCCACHSKCQPEEQKTDDKN